MNGFKTITLIVAMACLLVFSAAADLNSDLSVELRIDNMLIHENEINRLSYERGDVLDIRVMVWNEESNVTYRDVEVMGFITGYEFNRMEPMSDTAAIFDIDPNVKYRRHLSIPIPTAVDEDDYKLRIVVSDRNSGTVVKEYALRLDAPRRGFEIMDVIFSPGVVVEAGRALLTTVRVENKGKMSEDSVKVSIAIPELGISASDFINRVRSQDSESTQEMYMRIPVCAPAGNYKAVIEVRYNNLREAMYEQAVITVVDSDSCPGVIRDDKKPVDDTKPSTVISVGSTVQTLTAGEAPALYPLTVTNQGRNAVAYTVTVEGTSDFAQAEVNPVNTFVLNAGDSQAAYILLRPIADAAVGQRIFTVTVKAGDEVLKQIPLTAIVEESDRTAPGALGVREALEIGLIVLVVLLIILAVVVGVKKLKKDDEDGDDDEVEGKTYY